MYIPTSLDSMSEVLRTVAGDLVEEVVQVRLHIYILAHIFIYWS